MIQPLTPRQREIYAFIADYLRTHYVAPTLREIGAALGLSSLATVSAHLRALSAKGYLVRTSGRRHIRLLGPVEGTCPICGRAYDPEHFSDRTEPDS